MKYCDLPGEVVDHVIIYFLTGTMSIVHTICRHKSKTSRGGFSRNLPVSHGWHYSSPFPQRSRTRAKAGVERVGDLRRAADLVMVVSAGERPVHDQCRERRVVVIWIYIAGVTNIDVLLGQIGLLTQSHTPRALSPACNPFCNGYRKLQQSMKTLQLEESSRCGMNLHTHVTRLYALY